MSEVTLRRLKTACEKVGYGMSVVDTEIMISRPMVIQPYYYDDTPEGRAEALKDVREFFGNLRLKQKLVEAIGGFWNGGPKDTFYWHIDHHASGTEISRVGSYEANHFFDVATGTTDRATLGNARRKLAATAHKNGIDCTFEYVERR